MRNGDPSALLVLGATPIMPENAIVVCTWGAASASFPEDASATLTLGRKVSAASGAPLGCLLLGPVPDAWAGEARRFGASFVERIPDKRLGRVAADVFVEVLARYCALRRPRTMLFSQTFDVRMLAPRLAGRLGCGVVMNGVDLEIEGGKLVVTASSFGSATRSVYCFGEAQPEIVALMAGAALAEPVEGVSVSASVEDVAVDLSGTVERVRVVEPARRVGPRLEEAKIIVAGGRGLGKPENYLLIEQLAQVLGGMPAASRPIVDDGWTDPDRWVGLTGKVVAPDLYLAVGISGASQHMAGIGGARTLVAINKDPDAGIFRYARYGIVADAPEILPELIRLAGHRD
jgi:electron transfer flavoprotein alpha subunit